MHIGGAVPSTVFVCLTALILGSTSAVGQTQSCYTGGYGLNGQYALHNICPTATSDSQYVTSGTYKVAEVALQGVPYVLNGYYNSLDVFNVSNPLSATLLTSKPVQLPWLPSNEGTGGGLLPHLRGIATLDGFPYAFMSLYTAGWDFFKLGSSTNAFLKIGYNPGVASSFRYYGAALFVNGSDVLLAGQMIDATSISSRDYSVKLYKVGTTSLSQTPESLNYQTMQPVAVLAIGHSTDPAPYNTFGLSSTSAAIFPFTAGGSIYLLIANGTQAVAVSGQFPYAPVAMWTYSVTPGMFQGPWAIDRASSLLYVVNPTGAACSVATYDLSSFAANPQPLYNTLWLNPPVSHNNMPATVTVQGNLMVVGQGADMGYLSLAGSSGPVLLQSPDPNNATSDATSIVQTCVHPTLGATIMDLVAYTQNGQSYALRSLYAWSDIVGVSSACISTTPVPGLTVANQNASSGASCNKAAAAQGFPGDSFTVTNTSFGAWSNPQLLVTPPGATLPVQVPVTWSASNTATWTPDPTSAPGNYLLDLQVTDSTGKTYSTASNGGTKTVSLCGNPQAVEQVTAVNGASCTACTWLTNDTVTLLASPPISQGHPATFEWQFLYPLANASSTATGSPVNLTLGEQGTYTALVVAHYGFSTTPASHDPACDNSNYPFFAAHLSATGTYDSCSASPLVSQPFSVGSTLTSPTNNSTYLLSQSIPLQGSYKVSTGWTPSFSWYLDSATAPTQTFTATFSAGTVSGTVPAYNFSVGGSHTIYLISSATDGTGSVTPTPPQATFSVTNCQPAAAPTGLSASVSGQAPSATVTFNWQGGGTSPVTYRVRDTLGLVNYCSNVVNTTSCSWTASTAGSYSFVVDASNACSGGWQTSSTTGSFTVTGSSPPPPTPTPTPTPGGTLTLTASPNPANAGQAVTINFSPRVQTSGDSLTFYFGDGQGQTLTFIGIAVSSVTHTYATAGTFTVTGSGAASGTSVSGSTTVTVVNNCTATAPVAAFAWSPSQPRAGQTIQFTDTSTNGPTAWQWSFGDGAPPIIPGGSSKLENPTYSYANAGTYTVTLTASNCANPSGSQAQHAITVLPACSQLAAPQADFDWSPKGPLPLYPQQMQPYVGQTVTLTDTSTNNPTTRHWYDFMGEAPTDVTTQGPSITHVWTLPGDKNVRLVATNCVGPSAEKLKVVTIYPDTRPVGADFTWSPATPQTGVATTFAAISDDAHGNPTGFTWVFGDDPSNPRSGSPVNHTFTCGGALPVTLTATRGSYSGQTSKTVTVAGPLCGPESVVAPDAAKVNGLNGTSWRTDMRIFNPSDQPTQVWLGALPVSTDNTNPDEVGPFTIAPRAALVETDVLQTFWPGKYTKAAIRVRFDNPQAVAPLVVQHTYTPAAAGGTYGSSSLGVPVRPDTTPSLLWITGLRNDGTQAGFRTNVGLANLRGESVTSVKVTLFDGSGTVQGTPWQVVLPPYGFVQDSVKNVFPTAPNVGTMGTFSLKVALPSGTDVQPYASVVDNLTGDPCTITGAPLASQPLHVPSVAHLNGLNGTVWRTDLEVTNPDSAAHTWEIKFTPTGNSTAVLRTVTVASLASFETNDVVSWIYDGLGVSAPEVKGVVRIAPADGSQVLPAAVARTYNLTANGTFGQGIPALDVSAGAVAGGASTRLLLTGMSSADVARTNLGFVNLSDSGGVNFNVTFYDQSGNLLNPTDGQGKPMPYAVYLPPGGWDQDLLENRFSGAFGKPLGTNLTAISAVVQVVGGGPGFVYASVVDGGTGDPVFIGGQLAP